MRGEKTAKKAVYGIVLTLLLTSTLALAFNVQRVKAAGGTIYIRADGSIDPPTAPIQRDGNIYKLTADITSDTAGIVIERGNVTLDGAGWVIRGGGTDWGIQLSGVTQVTVRNTRVNGFYYGIWLYWSPNNRIYNNLLTGNHYGVWLWPGSNSNDIRGNNVTANDGVGIRVGSCVSNNISENDVTANGVDGIYVDYSSYNLISGNNITRSNFGVEFQYSSENTLSENNIAGNMYGVWLAASSRNTISGNHVTADPVAGDGIVLHDSSSNIISGNKITENLYGLALYSSSDNRIYHNNFVDNMQNQVYSSASTNAWEDGYPNGGNYWSNYVDVDMRSGPNQEESGNDGIWDHPYVVAFGNEDRYPLVNPWVPRIVGVQVGDWVKYSVEIVGYRPGFPVDLNDVEWCKTIVKGVSGTVIEAELLFHLKNGTEITATGTVDVVTSGYPGPTSMTSLFVSKDLPAGATLYATYPFGAIPPSLEINETVFREYLGVNRETNHIDATKYGIHIDHYWDRATGVLSEFNEEYRTYWSVHFEIVDTNVWEAPTPPTIMTSLDIDPGRLNLKSKGEWITAYIQLHEGYDAADVDASTVLLNGTITPVLDPKYGFVTNSTEYLVDYNNDGIIERMVKFDRVTAEEFIYNQGIRWGNVTLTITGKLLDGTPFEGSAVVFVRFSGDVNNDGRIDILDAAAVSAHWYPGPPAGLLGYDLNADLNKDGAINILDSGIVSGNWGQTLP